MQTIEILSLLTMICLEFTVWRRWWRFWKVWSSQAHMSPVLLRSTSRRIPNVCCMRKDRSASQYQWLFRKLRLREREEKCVELRTVYDIEISELYKIWGVSNYQKTTVAKRAERIRPTWRWPFTFSSQERHVIAAWSPRLQNAEKNCYK